MGIIHEILKNGYKDIHISSIVNGIIENSVVKVSDGIEVYFSDSDNLSLKYSKERQELYLDTLTSKEEFRSTYTAKYDIEGTILNSSSSNFAKFEEHPGIFLDYFSYLLSDKELVETKFKQEFGGKRVICVDNGDVFERDYVYKIGDIINLNSTISAK